MPASTFSSVTPDVRAVVAPVRDTSAEMARSIYSGTGSRSDGKSGVSFFPVHPRDSVDPAIVFVVPVALGNVSKII